jgi:hypothetical protein
MTSCTVGVQVIVGLGGVMIITGLVTALLIGAVYHRRGVRR